jgi:hypothetical protein
MKKLGLAVICAAALCAYGDIQLVEYVESDGTAYIDTGVCPSPAATRMKVVLSPTAVDSTARGMFGTRGTPNAADELSCTILCVQSKYRLDWTGDGSKTAAMSAGTRYTLDCCNQTVTLNGTAYSSAVTKATDPLDYPVFLFNINNAGSVYGNGMRMRLYSAEIYLDGTTLSARYLPAVTNGVAGVYDLVAQQFIAPAGGTLTASPTTTAIIRVNSDGDIEYKTVVAGANGSVSVTPEWALPGATVTATATADAGYTFFRWTGDIGNADPAEPAVTFTVGESTVTALFGRQLTVSPDGDGTTVYTNIEAAVAAAADYDTILVKDGTYRRTTTSFMSVAKPVKLVSENGREYTFIRGNYELSGDIIKTYCRGVDLNHPLAILKGFSIFNYGNDGDSSPFCNGLRIQAGLAEYCAVSNCRPNRGGCAVELSGTSAELRHSLVQRNRNNSSNGSLDRQGVVYIAAGTVTNCIIRNNSKSNSGNGGGVCLNGYEARLLGCEIFANSAAGSGGGVYLVNGLVQNCVITNNSGTAGGVYITGGTLQDSTVTANISGYTQKYGGVYQTDGTIDSCIIEGNIAYFPDGMQYKATGGTIRNTTVADSFGAIPSSDYVAVAANVTVENSAFQCPPVNGSTELNASVHFASGGDCWIEADKVVGLAPLVVRFKAHCEGAASYDWHFGAGATPSTSTLAEPEVTFADTGNHLVTLTCGTRSAQLEISVRAAVAYAATDGAAIYPYDTQAKAATSLQDALDAVYADDSVLGTVNVGAGTWKYTGSDVSGSFTPWLLVNKPVKVVGPADGEALFDADRRIMTLFLFHPRAVLERLTISNGRLNQNGLYGGSLHMMEGLVTNCVISKGYCNYGGNATIRGGSVWNSQFLQGTLKQSGEDRAGGGLQLHGGATVANSIFANNTGGYGGGFSVHHSSAIVSNCVVRNNSGGLCGGAGVGLPAGLVTHCVITNNTSSNGGGGARVSGGTLRNCLVAYNRANSTGDPKIGFGGAGGGGIAINGGTVENCTIAHNTSASSTRCDELYQAGGTVRNCISLGKDDVAANDVYKSSGTATYSFFRPSITGTGNIIADDPKLAAPASGDFTLMYGSPCIDTGMVITAVATDIRGVARPKGEKYDLGCYEMDFAGMLVASFEADVTSGGGDTLVTLTATVSGGTAPYTYFWTIDGVMYETDNPTYSHVFGYGSHDITLRVSDAQGNTTGDVTREALVTIKSPVVYISENGSGIWPYDTWERATSNWNAAVGAVYATDEVPGKIWVADGNYKASDSDIFTADLSIPVEFVGTNPACRAVFDGLNTKHAVVKLDNAKSCLRNVAIKNTRGGYMHDCGAIWLYNGVVSNCLIHHGYSDGGGAVRVSGGLFCDSVISNFNAGTHSGDDRFGGGLHLIGGTAERLIITDCTDGQGGGAYVGDANAVLRDSVIRGCYTKSGGAVYISAGLVENCIITNNTGNGRKSDGNVFTDYPGAGAYVAGGTLRNCLIADNRIDATHSGWEATQAGLYVANGTTYNNTVWANLLKSGVTNDVYVKGGTVANTIAYAYSNHNGTAECNFTGADPLFKRAGEFILVGSSPCVNAGANSYWGAEGETAKDLAGFKRIRNRTVDIGAYENQACGTLIIVR